MHRSILGALLLLGMLVGCTSPTGLGGGLQNNGTAVLEDCLIAGNLSEFGGGLFNGFSHRDVGGKVHHCLNVMGRENMI